MTGAGNEHVDAAVLFGLARRQQDPLHPGRPTHPGCRRAAELLDEPVVAPASAERGLGAQPLGHELEHGARVVVEAADQRRIDLILETRRVEQGADLPEVLGVLRRDPVDQPRSVCHHRLGAGVVRVEGAQRILLEPGAHLLGQLPLARA
jgi:hypothetical protein